MSDPMFKDPRFDSQPPLRDEDIRDQRMAELNSSNAMWGWIAGAVVLALVLVFVFARGQSVDTASNSAVPTAPSATTGAAPPASLAPPATSPLRPAPSTTGQGPAR